MYVLSLLIFFSKLYLCVRDSFSEKKTKEKSMDVYSEELYSFTLQFYRLFPDMRKRDLYIGGQSYGMRYSTDLAYRIHKRFRPTGNPLKGIYVGGPYFSLLLDEHVFDLPYTLGALSYSDVEKCKSNARRLRESLRNNEVNNLTILHLQWTHHGCMSGNHALLRAYNFETDDAGKNGLYDELNYIDDHMHSNFTKEILHVGSRKWNSKRGFDILTDLIDADDKQLLKAVYLWKKDHRKLEVLMDNYKVLLYNGDYDVITSSAAVEEGIRSTRWKLQKKYNSSREKVAREVVF